MARSPRMPRDSVPSPKLPPLSSRAIDEGERPPISSGAFNLRHYASKPAFNDFPLRRPRMTGGGARLKGVR